MGAGVEVGEAGAGGCVTGSMGGGGVKVGGGTNVGVGGSVRLHASALRSNVIIKRTSARRWFISELL
jgi:hypothetical protein